MTARRVVLGNKATRALDRLDAKIEARIRVAIKALASSGQGDVSRLQGVTPPAFRLRVGKWRVIFETPQPGVLEVTEIENCGEAYRNTR